MSSALRADAPDFVPSLRFDTCTTTPHQSDSSSATKPKRKHRRQRHQKPPKSATKQRSGRDGNDKNRRNRRGAEAQDPSHELGESSLQDVQGVVEATTEELAFSTSFASVLRRDVASSDPEPSVPAGWAVLRPRRPRADCKLQSEIKEQQQQRKLNDVESSVVTSKLATSTEHPERIQRLRRRLWESMDRLQQKKRSKAPSVPAKEESSTCDAGEVYDNTMAYASVHREPRASCPRPIYVSAEDGDEATISQLQEGLLPSTDEDYRRCLDVAVLLDRALIVRRLCSHWVGSSSGTAKKKLQKQQANRHEERSVHPLLTAVALERDECLQILLSSFPLSGIWDVDGNTALHVAARQRNLETFRLVWKQQSTQHSHQRKHGAAFKFISRRNHRGQTFLHVACEYSATDIVDWILRRNEQRSLVSKLLLMEDEDTQTPLLAAIAVGATDCVMNFLMQGAAVVTGSRSCPLRWAVRSKTASSSAVEMVALLLEFHGNDDTASTSVYDWHGALFDCLVRRDDVNDKLLSLQLLRLLIEAGANPFEHSASQKKKARSTSTFMDSAVWVAVDRDDADALAVMLKTYDKVEARRRELRRKDPKLKQQPESFFVGLESGVDLERRSNLQISLLASLYHMQKSAACSKKKVLTVLALYKHGATLDESHLWLLKESLRRSTLILVETPYVIKHSLHTKGYQSLPKPGTSTSSEWKRPLVSLPWFDCRTEQGILCTTMLGTSSGCDRPALFDCPRILIRSQDNIEFLVHEEVLDERCEKLAGAVRFARAAHSKDDEHVELDVSLRAIQCRWLLEHLYCNTILTPLPNDPVQCCNELLELCLVSDEYLCWSLLQECEMRLIAHKASFNICYCSECRSNAPPYWDVQSASSSGSSFLINKDTALSVLALAKELLDTSPIILNEVYFTTVRTYEGWKKRPALRAASDLATRYLLSNFGEVVRYGGWAASQCTRSERDATSEFGMFLSYCIEEIVDKETTSMVT